MPLAVVLAADLDAASAKVAPQAAVWGQSLVQKWPALTTAVFRRA